MLINQCFGKVCWQILTTGDLHLQPVINIPELSSVSYTTGGRRPVHVAFFALKGGQLGTILSVRCVRHAIRLQNTRSYYKLSEWCRHTESLLFGLQLPKQACQCSVSFAVVPIAGVTSAGDNSLACNLRQVTWHNLIAQGGSYS